MQQSIVLYSLVSPIVMNHYGNLSFVFPVYTPVEQKVMDGQFHVHDHLGVLKNVNTNGNILQRYFTHKFYGYQLLWPTCFGEKHLFQNVIFPPFSILFLQ